MGGGARCWRLLMLYLITASLSWAQTTEIANTVIPGSTVGNEPTSLLPADIENAGLEGPTFTHSEDEAATAQGLSGSLLDGPPFQWDGGAASLQRKETTNQSVNNPSRKDIIQKRLKELDKLELELIEKSKDTKKLRKDVEQKQSALSDAQRTSSSSKEEINAAQQVETQLKTTNDDRQDELHKREADVEAKLAKLKEDLQKATSDAKVWEAMAAVCKVVHIMYNKFAEMLVPWLQDWVNDCNKLAKNLGCPDPPNLPPFPPF